MKRQKKFPGALVPDYLTTLTIEKLPLDQPYYVLPGEPDDNDMPKIFVTEDRKLRMDKGEIIPGDYTTTSDPTGRVGIMKTLLVDEQAGFREAYVADLRFVESYAIIDIDKAPPIERDQEFAMDWFAMVEDSIVFEGFIAPEIGDEFDPDEEFPSGVLYGDKSLRPALKKLRKRTNKLMDQFMNKRATQAEPIPVKPAEAEDGNRASVKPTTEVIFSHKQ